MRLIAAEPLKESMDETLMPGKDVVLETYIDEVVCAVIDDAPTVDAIPVRHAYAIKNPVLDRFNYCVCSNCHTNISPQWKVCPACSTLDCITLMNGEPKDEDVPSI